jgi:hypothetical protein
MDLGFEALRGSDVWHMLRVWRDSVGMWFEEQLMSQGLRYRNMMSGIGVPAECKALGWSSDADIRWLGN